MKRKEQLERIISKGKTNYVLTSMAIYSIVLSIVLVIGSMFGIGSIAGIEWILIAFITFVLGVSALLANTHWKKMNEEYRKLKK